MSQSKTAILAASPTWYCPLDETSGTTAVDAVGFQNGVYGSSVVVGGDSFGTSAAPRFPGLNAVTSAVSVAPHSQFSQPYNNALTVICWFKTSVANFNQTDGGSDKYIRLMSYNKYSYYGAWEHRFYNSNASRPFDNSFYQFKNSNPNGLGNGADTYHHPELFPAVQIGQWYFIVGMADAYPGAGAGSQIWRNGVQETRTSSDTYATYGVTPWDPTSVTGSKLWIGGDGNHAALIGSIAHTAIWNRQLTSNEVTSIYNAGVSDLTAPPNSASISVGLDLIAITLPPPISVNQGLSITGVDPVNTTTSTSASLLMSGKVITSTNMGMKIDGVIQVNAYVSHGLKLIGEYWEPDFDPFTQPAEPNLAPIGGEENAYWYEAGVAEGQLGYPSRVLLIQQEFQKDYQSGWSAGSWYYKVRHQN